MDGESLVAFVRQPRYAVLTTARPDGRPHAALVAFVVRDGRVWLPAVAGAVRVRNVAREPWASLAITEGFRERHRAVLVEGHAIVHAEAGEVERLLNQFLREAWREVHGTELDWASAVLELRPVRVLSHDATAS
jgi:PPOX class probable F420-dependent enzyme